MSDLPRRIAVLFLLGGAAFTIDDHFHVASQTTAYPQGVYGWYFWNGMPFWVPLLFGPSTVLGGLLLPWMDGLLGRPQRPGSRNWTQGLAGFLAFFLLYASSGYLPWQTGGGDDLALAAGAIAIWAVWDRTWQGILQGLITAAIGTAFEMTLVHLGVFSYVAPNLNGVASWLPWLYFAAAVAIGNLGRLLRDRNARATLPPPSPLLRSAA